MSTVAAANAAAQQASSTTASGQRATATDRAQIAGNFDQFLQLLTTQLRNQSPLEPLDTNQFTQQLVQFAQVEQQLKQNETLTSLLTMSKSATTANAMSFVGTRVTTDGSSSSLSGGSAQWQLNAPRAGTAQITIRDKNNKVVATETATLQAGVQDFRWSGRTSTGGTAVDGEYNIVVDALDTQRTRMQVSTEVTGVVGGVDYTGEAPRLRIGSTLVPLDRVRSVAMQGG